MREENNQVSGCQHEPNLSSQHPALAMNETDAILKMSKRRETILVLSPGRVGGLCQHQETAQKALPSIVYSGVLCPLIHPWVRWELFLSSCCVLARPKCSSCEPLVLQALLPQTCQGITCKATHRCSKKTKGTHGTCTSSLWPPTLGSWLSRDLWARGSAYLLC